ncbi:glutamate racemase [Streptomyces oceani]|uniref:Glutamate racemase n=1 Tax=Streptomyces oceani TaxID=1075402 RepID=A0A1E7JY02_9ACTN|nr:aspartate/glutamate racemase family protein [Streptomyces oceani]OEU96493.1 glutamate racemase [Streptomyces oceani]
MKIALVDSGIGLLPAAAAMRRALPDTDLVLSSDPDSMPWGPRPAEDIAERALACARAAAGRGPDALIVACNTASVYALPALRAELEPRLPVIGTVPAVKPAVRAGGPVAIWATPATTGSPYQRRLIADFGDRAPLTEVACHGLADAIERADEPAIAAAISAAAERTPPGARAIVLGCTHYELVADQIRAAVRAHAAPELELLGSASAVVAQALRRTGAEPDPGVAATGRLTVLHGGVESELGAGARAYPEGRLLLLPDDTLQAVAPDARDPRGAPSPTGRWS